MSRKRRMREMAMQVLFLWDTNTQADEDMARQLVTDASEDPQQRDGALQIARSAWDQRETADRWVARLAPHWPAHRQPAVDRNLLRLAIWELTSTPTPPKIVLDEAIEMAKEFSTEQSASFVNAVLDAILKEHQALLQAKPEMETGTKEQQEQAEEQL